MIAGRADTLHRRGRTTKSVDSWPPWKRRLHWLCHLLRPPADQGTLFGVVLVRVRSCLGLFRAKNRIPSPRRRGLPYRADPWPRVELGRLFAPRERRRWRAPVRQRRGFGP